MAIKITGTTVINNERKFENITNVSNLIHKPSILNLVDSGGLTLEGSAYEPLYSSDSRDYREFQIDLDSGDFSNPERTNQIDADSWLISPDLASNFSYKARIRDVSINGTVSNWSELLRFTVDQTDLNPPVVTVEGSPSSVPRNPTISTSAFSDPDQTDTHASTDWRITRTSDNTLIFQSLFDTENLTSITLVDKDLDQGEEYEFSARHRGISGQISDFASTTATALTTFGPTTLGEPYEGGFYMGTIASTQYLIVSPAASGSAYCQWKTENTLTPGTDSTIDGGNNTYPALANSTHPAGNFTATATINGYDDWYLPASEELLELYQNGAGTASDPLPSGDEMMAAEYWSSTEIDADSAETFNFSDGTPETRDLKTDLYYVRAIRRSPII